MVPLGADREAPEQRARQKIDVALATSGWTVQHRDEMNVSAGRGVDVRELKLTAGHGYAGYLLFIDGKAVGVLEAKAEGFTSSTRSSKTSHAPSSRWRRARARRSSPSPRSTAGLNSRAPGASFLVDRANLGEQAEKELQSYRTPDDKRKLTELYDVQRLTSNTIGASTKV